MSVIILVGPIAVNGAEPGDVLEVKILELHPADNYAENLFVPDGTLTEDLPQARARFVPLDKVRKVAVFAPGIEIPMHPFFGTMGVAPAAWLGRINDGPPDYFGGNLDNKDLVAGAVLYIPVQVKGAMFSVGDGQAGQGDGEVDGTALEVALHGKLQLTIRKDMHLLWPRAETQESYITMGFSPDLNRAAALPGFRTLPFFAGIEFSVGKVFLGFFRHRFLAFEVSEGYVTRGRGGSAAEHLQGLAPPRGIWFHFAERMRSADQICRAYYARFKAHTNTPATVRTVAEISG